MEGGGDEGAGEEDDGEQQKQRRPMLFLLFFTVVVALTVPTQHPPLAQSRLCGSCCSPSLRALNLGQSPIWGFRQQSIVKFAVSKVRKPRPPFSNPTKSIFNARAFGDRVNGFQFRHGSILQYSSSPRGSSVRSYRKRVNRRLRVISKPVLDEARFNKAKSLLLPRFTADHLHDVIVREENPLFCLELFNWAS